MLRQVNTTLIACLLVTAYATAADTKNVSNLWTANPHIQAAQFHVLLLYAFDENVTANTKPGIDVVLRKFSKELIVLSDHEPALTNKYRVARLSKPPGFRYNFNVSADGPVLEKASDLWQAIDYFEGQIRDSPGGAEVPHVGFVYVLSHGLRRGDQVYLNIGSGAENEVSRDVLVQRVKKVQSDQEKLKLVVLITDSCAGAMPNVGTAARDGELTLAAQASTNDRQRPLNGSTGDGVESIGGVWRALYFGHSGFVHVAAAKNELGWARAGGETVFVSGFREALQPNSIKEELSQGAQKEFDEASLEDKIKLFIKHLDPDHEGVLTWEKFLPYLQKRVDAEFKRLRRGIEAQGSLPEDLKSQTEQRIEWVNETRILPSR